MKKWRYAANTVTAVTAPYIRRNENTQQPAQYQRKADSEGSQLGLFLFEAAKNLASPMLHPYVQYRRTKRISQSISFIFLPQNVIVKSYLTSYFTSLP